MWYNLQYFKVYNVNFNNVFKALQYFENYLILCKSGVTLTTSG